MGNPPSILSKFRKTFYFSFYFIFQAEYEGDAYYSNYEDRYSDVDPYEPKMPEIIKKFLLYFRNAINEGIVYDMQNLYENT